MLVDLEWLIFTCVVINAYSIETFLMVLLNRKGRLPKKANSKGRFIEDILPRTKIHKGACTNVFHIITVWHSSDSAYIQTLNTNSLCYFHCINCYSTIFLDILLVLLGLVFPTLSSN